jgi:hypothetical protein
MVRLSSAFVLVATLVASAFAAPSMDCVETVVRDTGHIGDLMKELDREIRGYRGQHEGLSVGDSFNCLSFVRTRNRIHDP